MKKSVLIFSTFLLTGLFTSIAFCQSGSSGSNGNDSQAIAWRQVTVTGTIVSINADSQKVTLKDNKGNSHTLTVVPGVKLDSLKQGDQVSATFFQSIALQVREPTSQERQNPIQYEDGVTTAPPGTQPAGGGVRLIKAVVKITAQDQSTQTVTVSGPKGGSSVIYIPDRTTFEKLKKGTEALIVYTEAIAVKIDKK